MTCCEYLDVRKVEPKEAPKKRHILRKLLNFAKNSPQVVKMPKKTFECVFFICKSKNSSSKYVIAFDVNDPRPGLRLASQIDFPKRLNLKIRTRMSIDAIDKIELVRITNFDGSNPAILSINEAGHLQKISFD